MQCGKCIYGKLYYANSTWLEGIKGKLLFPRGTDYELTSRFARRKSVTHAQGSVPYIVLCGNTGIGKCSVDHVIREYRNRKLNNVGNA